MRCHMKILLVLTVYLGTIFFSSEAAINILTTLLRDNIAGPPVAHKLQMWPFDPDEGARRNPEFEAIHGHRSEILIEKLGLGVDGRQEERRREQIIRDIGIPISSHYG